ncbi:MAG: phosphatidylserine decarboxylase [Deltaproteobacteria bacterium]|nr:phosphatidylserine decarboxylase [Deltaproteobacteria bacterium]
MGRGAKPPPPPSAVRRRLLGQALIDALLQVSGPLARPAASRLERLWLEAWSRPGVSALAGRIADLRLPRPVLTRLIEGWIKAYHVDTAAMAEPVGAYPTLNAFFTRRLRTGLRPIEPDPALMPSPADSVLTAFGPIDARGRIPEIKGRTYGVAELLAGAMDAAPFTGGSFAVFYLSPRDYHRVHSPVSGRLVAATPIGGRTYPVNARGVRVVEGLFATNKRVVFDLDGDGFGRVALVMVGATNVGRITVSAPPGPIARGDELGVFNLGSTVVMLFPASHPVALAGVHEGELVQVGQAVARVIG